jgi:type I restriction enzyme S subunit
MEEWKEYKVAEVIEEISMGPFGSNIKRDNYVDSGVPYLNGSNLSSYKLNEESFNYVTDEKAKSLGRCVAKRGDVIVTHRGTIGQISYIPYDSKYENYLTGNSQFRLTVNNKVIRPDFFVYYFHTRMGQHRLLANASQVGVPALARPTSTFKEVLVSVPKMEVQNKIMDILHSLDDKIEVNRRINNNLEQQAQALFKSWFVDFEPFKDQFFVESEFGMIPQGWKVATLGEIGEVVGGSTPSKAKPEYYTDHGIAWLTPKDLSVSNAKFTAKGEFDITQEGYDSCSTKLMPKGTVLFSSRAPIGYITIAKNDICTNQGFKSVVPKYAGTAFIYCYLKSATPDIENKATGSTFKEASGSFMKSLQLIIAPKDIMNAFEECLKPLFAEQKCVEDESRRLAELRDSLLPRLMSGELSVKDIKE